MGAMKPGVDDGAVQTATKSVDGLAIALEGTPLSLRVDGELWERTAGRVTADVPVKPERVRELLGTVKHNLKLEPCLVAWDQSLVPPTEILRGWVCRLLEIQGREACALYAKHPKPDEQHLEWMAVCPEQESTGGGFYITERHLGEMCEWLFREGYDLAGTIHTHPGNHTGASSVDTGAWEKFPGLHFIAGRDGSWTLYAVAGGKTFTTGWVGKFTDLTGAKGTVYTPGGQPLAETVKKRKWGGTATTVRSGTTIYDSTRGYSQYGEEFEFDGRKDGWTVIDREPSNLAIARAQAALALKVYLKTAKRLGDATAQTAARCARACLNDGLGGR